MQVYEQWPILTRHGAEILGATGGSALFSMLTTAGMARLAGLPPGVVRAMVPRSGGPMPYRCTAVRTPLAGPHSYAVRIQALLACLHAAPAATLRSPACSVVQSFIAEFESYPCLGSPTAVTMALALPIAAQLDAPQPITAAAVALTGIAGSALVLPLLNAARFRDPIARGLAAAAAAHGLGTAALAAKEPEALPYCALAYAACGVLASLLAALPPLRALLLAIAG